MQVDVACVNWQSKDLLIGECKWTGDPINRAVVRELVENKMPKVLSDMSAERDEWNIQYAYFSRNGFTEAAHEEAKRATA